MDPADVYRVFHPNSTQYTFFSAAHGSFSKTDHVLGHKASLSKYKKKEIIPCILSDHNALKLELNNKNNSRKYANNWKLNNTLLNDQWVIDEIKEEIKRFLEVDEIKEEIKRFLEVNEMKTLHTRTCGTQQRHPNKEVYVYECIY
jgi:hypothetical protein